MTIETVRLHGGHCLDIASGTGGSIAIIDELADSIDYITAIDISIENIEKAADKYKSRDIRFMNMDAHHMLFDDNKFDCAVIANSLHHFSNPLQVLTECCRVLRPDGDLAILEMFSDNQTDRQMTHVFIHHWWAEIDTALGVSHNITFTKQDINGMIVEAGFEIMENNVIDNTKYMPPEKMIDTIKGHIDSYIKRASQLPSAMAIEEEGRRLKRRMDEVGFLFASQVLIIGRKPKH